VNSVVELSGESFDGLRAMAGGQMPIALHQAEIAPASKHLNCTQIGTTHDQPTREGLSERMQREPRACETGILAGAGEQFVHG